MEIRIAVIPYLNCAPFYWNKSILSGSELKIRWISATPKALGQLAKQQAIDAGPVSMVDSFEIEENYEELSSLGIAVKKSAESVILFSKKPLQILNIDENSIGLTEESATSIHLLKFILEGRHGIHTKYRLGFKKEDEARLLIGNKALEALLDSDLQKQYPYRIDLGEEWMNWQKLPFVFARWMVRKNLDLSIKKELEQLLVDNVNLGKQDLEKVISVYNKETHFNFPQGKEYLSAFNYIFGKREKQSIDLFRKMIEQSKN